MPAAPNFATLEFAMPRGAIAQGVDVAPSGRSFATVGSTFMKPADVIVWNADSAQPLLHEKLTNKEEPRCVRYSPDAQRLAIALRKSVRIVDAATLERLADVPLDKDTLLVQLDWDASGEKLAGGGLWDAVRVWDVKSREMRSVVSVQGKIGLVAFLPNRPELLLAAERRLKIWNPTSDRTEPVLRLPKNSHQDDWVYALTWDRSAVFAASNFGTLCQIESASWSMKSFTLPRKKGIQSAAMARDGSCLALGYSDGTILLWDVAEQRIVFRHVEEHSEVRYLAFLEDSRQLFCALDASRLLVLDFRPGASNRRLARPEKPPGAIACVQMGGSDSRMDQSGNMDVPVNSLPIKCQKCHLPDLDHVAEPYFLCKGTSQPTDMALAEVGNFLVRERAKVLLEIAAPGQCRFFGTCNLKTKQPTPWFLAVPVNTVGIDTVQARVPRCRGCGEPLSAHPGSQYDDRESENASPYDVFKSLNWATSSTSFKKKAEIRRHLYFSVRLETLLKRLKVRGLDRNCFEKERTTADDLQWVEQQMARITAASHAGAGPAADSTGAESQRAAEWFAEFLAQHKAKTARQPDFAALQERHGIALPESYQQFAREASKRIFRDVDGIEGFTARILPPEKLEFREYRHTDAEAPDASAGQIDGVVFAVTDHGDLFCFNLAESSKADYPVYHYLHELDLFEPYAANFMECLQRFVTSGAGN